MFNISAMQTNNPAVLVAAFAANGLSFLATKAVHAAALPTARYLVSRAPLFRLFALLLLFVFGMVAVFAAAALLVPLLTALGGLLWAGAVVVAPVVLKIVVGGLLIAGFAIVTRPV